MTMTLKRIANDISQMYKQMKKRCEFFAVRLPVRLEMCIDRRTKEKKIHRWMECKNKMIYHLVVFAIHHNWMCNSIFQRREKSHFHLFIKHCFNYHNSFSFFAARASRSLQLPKFVKCLTISLFFSKSYFSSSSSFRFSISFIWWITTEFEEKTQKTSSAPRLSFIPDDIILTSRQKHCSLSDWWNNRWIFCLFFYRLCLVDSYFCFRCRSIDQKHPNSFPFDY